MNKNSQGLALWPYIEDRIKHLWMPGLIFLEWEINDVSVGRRKWLPNKEHVYMVTMTKKRKYKKLFFFSFVHMWIHTFFVLFTLFQPVFLLTVQSSVHLHSGTATVKLGHNPLHGTHTSLLHQGQQGNLCLCICAVCVCVWVFLCFVASVNGR